MTTTFVSGIDVAKRIEAKLPGATIKAEEGFVLIEASRVVEVALFLRDDPELDCKYLNSLTAVDWLEYFEIVYHLSSLAKNQALVVKARADHEQPVVPSVSSIWLGAHLQEREVFDLMGIPFEGHPAMKRIFLWEGFPGHPLRKDFLSLPGGERPGLPRFPYEFPAGQAEYPALQNTDQPVAPTVPQLGQEFAKTEPGAPENRETGQDDSEATPS